MIRFRLRHFLRSILASFWFWPLVFVVLALYLAFVVPDISRHLSLADEYAVGELASSARAYAVAILTATAAADITIITFVFSTFMVVLQLASSQLSPRVLRPTLREGRAQLSMAVMTGGFVFSIASLLGVHGEQRSFAVAGPVFVSVIWTIVIVLTFLDFVGYTASRIQAPSVIRAISRETARTIQRTYGWREPAGETREPELTHATTLRSPRDGVLTGINVQGLTAWGNRWNTLVELEVGLGSYVSAGVRIGRVLSDRESHMSGSPLRFLVIENERTLRGDPPYGFRLLVDIANRALSPAINDPTTAVQVLDELQSLLVLLAGRPERPGRVYDKGDVLRLKVPTMGWNAYLGLAVQEIYESGRDSSTVTQRISHMLEELSELVSGDRATAVENLRGAIEVIPPMVASCSDPAAR